MGIYDRDYARGPDEGLQLSAPRTATMQIVVVCAIVYLTQIFFPAVTELLKLPADWVVQPWRAFQLLTYGFLHDDRDIAHILINMIVLWMFGTQIEQIYGRREFLSLYLTAVVFAGVVWSLLEWLSGASLQVVDPASNTPVAIWPSMLGASGAISAVFVLFALNFPHRQVLFMFFIPMPMWLAALIALFIDGAGAISRSGNVAYTAHLAGALYGYLFFRYGWSPGRWIGDRLGNFTGPRRPKLKVHRPDPEEELSTQVDKILAKIQEQGQDSLTRSERKTLERASRQYQQKRTPPREE